MSGLNPVSSLTKETKQMAKDKGHRCWCTDNCGWEGYESQVQVLTDKDGDNIRLCPRCNSEVGVDFEDELQSRSQP